MTTEPDLSTQSRRPEASLGELVGELTNKLSTLLRQEVELAKTEAREEVSRAGKAVALMAVAGVAAVLALGFLSAGLAWLLDHVMDVALAFAIVGALWAIAAVLAASGRRRIVDLQPLPETKQSIKEDVEWARAQRS